MDWDSCAGDNCADKSVGELCSTQITFFQFIIFRHRATERTRSQAAKKEKPRKSPREPPMSETRATQLYSSSSVSSRMSDDTRLSRTLVRNKNAGRGLPESEQNGARRDALDKPLPDLAHLLQLPVPAALQSGDPGLQVCTTCKEGDSLWRPRPALAPARSAFGRNFRGPATASCQHENPRA